MNTSFLRKPLAVSLLCALVAGVVLFAVFGHHLWPTAEPDAALQVARHHPPQEPQTHGQAEPDPSGLPSHEEEPFIVRNSLRSDESDDRTVQLRVTPLEGHVDRMQIDLLLPDLVLEPAPEGMVPRMPGEASHFRQGVPDLPVVSRLVDGQEGKSPRVELLNASFRDLPNLDVAPMPWTMTLLDLDGAEQVETFRWADDSIYGEDAFWPAELVQVEQARQRGRTHVRLAFNPVQYNPATRTLRYYEQISARLVFASETEEHSFKIEPASGPATMSAADPCDCPPWTRDSAVPAAPNGIASEFAARRAGAEVGAHYRFAVQTAGLYRVTGAALLAAGAPSASLVGSQIRVYNRDREVAVATSTNGAMGPDDWILLYAQGFDGLYSGSNVYWIGFGGEGFRMELASGAPLGAAPTVDSHCQTVTYGRDFPGVTPFFNGFVLPQNESLDHWFSRQLTSIQTGPLEQLTVALPTDFPVAGGEARVCVRLVGVTVSNHLSRVRFNGQMGADFQWYQQPITQSRGSLFEGSALFSSTVLTHPSTTMNVSQQVVGPQFADQTNIDTIRLIYPRELRAVSDRLEFKGQAGARNYRVSSFSETSGLWALDISDPYEPRRLTGFGVETTPSDGVRVQVGLDTVDPPTLYVAHTQAVQQIAVIEKVPFRNLADPERGADWIVVTPYAFRDSVYMLTTNRYVQGSRVVVAPLPDIYNEFSYGIPDAEAIRHFIGYAYHHWQGEPPLGVLLAGRATFDPRNYRNYAAKTVIPSPFGGTTDTYTGLDTRLGLVDGPDNLADVAVGRILATSNGEVQNVVNKILAFEAAPIGHAARSRATLVTGRIKNPGENFGASAEVLAGILNGAGFSTVQKLYDCNCNPQIRSAIDAGRFTVSYMGHGAADRWDASSANTSSNLFMVSDVASLSNTFYPIVCVFTCQNGYYLSPTQISLAQAFLQTAAKGASALVAPTALSQAIASDRVAEGFYEALAADEVRSLGEAMMNGQLKLFSTFGSSPTELLMYQVFGDPGMVVNPETPAP